MYACSFGHASFGHAHNRYLNERKPCALPCLLNNREEATLLYYASFIGSLYALSHDFVRGSLMLYYSSHIVHNSRFTIPQIAIVLFERKPFGYHLVVFFVCDAVLFYFLN